MHNTTGEVEFLDVIDAATFLGVKDRTVRRWVAERGLPHVRIGHVLRFRRQALREWMEQEEARTMAAAQTKNGRAPQEV